jgi:hypothetical protein
MDSIDSFPTTTPQARRKVSVEEIHQSFQKEADSLVVQAKALLAHPISLAPLPYSKEQIEEFNKLYEMGFSKAKEVSEYRKEVDKQKARKEMYENDECMARAIEHYILYYPMQKFITHTKVMEICATYGLVLGESSDYKADIPAKNRKEIVSFKLREEDKFMEVRHNHAFGERSEWAITKNTYEMYNRNQAGIASLGMVNTYTEHRPAKMRIVATPDMMDLSGKQVVANQLVELPKDPVVLQPVNREGMHGYLIVSLWGEESKIEDLQNPKQN